ncbi:MAG TPA: RDD family protein [Jatrophihabitantaceae bacterium]|nr:RDD family protein [Jatrophihabitantaceae bacterium]
MSSADRAPAPDLVSGEGVALQLPRARIGSRLVATLIDVVIQILGALVLIFITSALTSGTDPAAAAALIVTEAVLVIAGYPILTEWLNHGRTFGKAALGLRVVRDDGGPISFRQALVRGLASLVLEKPGLGFPVTTSAGLLTALFSERSKRLGDLMAGTFVIYERGGPQRSIAPQHFTVPYPLQPWAMALDLNRLDDHLALAVRQFVMRAHQMTPAAQHALGERLRAQLEAVTAPPPPPGTPTPLVLTTVLAERRRRADLRAATPPAYRPPAPPPTTPRPPTDGTGFAPPA